MRNAYGFPVRDYGVSAGADTAAQRGQDLLLEHCVSGVSHVGVTGLAERFRTASIPLGGAVWRERRVPRRVSPLTR